MLVSAVDRSRSGRLLAIYWLQWVDDSEKQADDGHRGDEDATHSGAPRRFHDQDRSDNGS